MRCLSIAFALWLSSIAVALAAVDANTATPEALQTVSGIGPGIARRIVEERRRGPYRNLDDLQARVKGIGESTARRLARAGLTVGEGSRAPRASPAGPGEARTARAAADAKRRPRESRPAHARRAAP
jgi:competence protein ComEA